MAIWGPTPDSGGRTTKKGAAEANTRSAIHTAADRLRVRSGGRGPVNQPPRPWRSPARKGIGDSWAAARAEAERRRKRELAERIRERNRQLSASERARRDMGLLDPFEEVQWGPERAGAEPTPEVLKGIGRPGRDDDLEGEGQPLIEGTTLPGIRTQLELQEEREDREDPRAEQARRDIALGDEPMPGLRQLEPEEKMNALNMNVINRYLEQVREWREGVAGRPGDEVGIPGIDEDGMLGTSGTTQRNPFYGYLAETAPPMLLVRDENGRLSIESHFDVMTGLYTRLTTNPDEAAAWQSVLAASGAYAGSQEKYPQYRLGRWNVDDDTALEKALQGAAMVQMDMAQRAMLAGEPIEVLDYQEIIAQRAEQGVELADAGAVTESGGSSGYSRSGGYGYGGGFGGGGGGGYTQTDSEMLRQLVNGIARSRMGRALTAEESAAFISHFHSQEAAYYASREAGATAEGVDPEGQAASWLESYFSDEIGEEGMGTNVVNLVNFLMGGGFSQ